METASFYADPLVGMWLVRGMKDERCRFRYALLVPGDFATRPLKDKVEEGVFVAVGGNGRAGRIGGLRQYQSRDFTGLSGLSVVGTWSKRSRHKQKTL